MPSKGASARVVALGDVLVTGGGGFAGGHLIELLRRTGSAPDAPPHGELDLRDADAVRLRVAAAEPAVVFHLAAFSSPSESWRRPREALMANVEMTLNVLEATRLEAPQATVVLAGSAQVYGESAAAPASEDAPLSPGNPYAISKATGDMLGRQYAESLGLRVVRLRPFNHAGPGQADAYVLSSLARQVADAEAAGAAEVVLRTGNPDAARDFTDVRDVVRAYALAATLPGGTFNVCSGRSTSVAQLVELVAAATAIPVRHEVDPTRLRAHDARTMRGSHARLTEATGWEPEIPLERTVRDTLDWWRGLSGGAKASGS